MSKAEKLDLYKAHRDDYRATATPRLVTIGPAHYLAIKGRGAPGGPAFVAKIGALYNMAFTIKMARKFAGRDYAVCKLEALWWGSRKRADFFAEPADKWNWKLMIRVPEFITSGERDAAVAGLVAKGKSREVAEVALESFDEGRCVQMLHVGPYANEPETIVKMTEFARTQGLKPHGLHHEIYLSDPRRVAPARLKTILRIPVRS